MIATPETASTETDVLQFNPETKPVYRALAEHQVHEESWELRELLAWLQVWSNRFIDEFTLAIAETSLCVDWLDSRRYGHFRRGLNGFGLVGEIALNRRYLSCREPWELLGTLLHELLHAWQEKHGRPGRHNYHNAEFRRKARAYGLVIDSRGHTHYEADSRFFQLLTQHGVEAPAIPPNPCVLPGQSKLKKWTCGCRPPINVRVAVPHFHARCLWCGCVFRRSD